METINFKNVGDIFFLYTCSEEGDKSGNYVKEEDAKVIEEKINRIKEILYDSQAWLIGEKTAVWAIHSIIHKNTTLQEAVRWGMEQARKEEEND